MPSDSTTLPALPNGSPRWLAWLHWGLTAIFGVVGVWAKLDGERTSQELESAKLSLRTQAQGFDQELKTNAAALEAQRQHFAEELQRRTSDLDERRERIQRYEFVMRTLSDVDPDREPKRASLAVSVVRLALEAEEQKALFAFLEISADAKSKSIGETGVAQLEASETKSNQAEQEGYGALAKGDFEKARELFVTAEKQSPGRHSNYEIANILKQQKGLQDQAQQIELLKRITRSHLQFAPPSTRAALQGRVPMPAETAQ